MKKNSYVYIMKGIAIILVVAAHCQNRVSYSDLDAGMNVLRGYRASVGVPLFL